MAVYRSVGVAKIFAILDVFASNNLRFGRAVNAKNSCHVTHPYVSDTNELHKHSVATWKFPSKESSY
jgi:hypothetical protein